MSLSPCYTTLMLNVPFKHISFADAAQTARLVGIAA